MLKTVGSVIMMLFQFQSISLGKAAISPPIINISDLFSTQNPNNYQNIQATIQKIADASIKWGFFYVTNHSIDDQLIRNLTAITQKFFLNSTTKQLDEIRRASNNSRGYTDMEFTKQKIDLKRVFDVGHKPHAELPDMHPGYKNHHLYYTISLHNSHF